MAARDRVKYRLARDLLAWYEQGHRDLPWRRTQDPYSIWVSEVMLQQTRAQTVIPYYERFLARFPEVTSLAHSTEEEVLTLWSGLGYYSRARNLRRAAIQIQAAGGFPRRYEEIRALPGIGDYTAAAVASIAFGLPHAVVDGNVLRVVARVENDASDIGAAVTRERFRRVAQSWLDPKNAGAFNQALMELGATICVAGEPLCLLCPVSRVCQAHQQGTASELPVKLRAKEPVRLEETLLVISNRGRVLLRQTEAYARRMAAFWELPTPAEVPETRIASTVGSFRHSITHHRYTFTVARAVRGVAAPKNRGFRWWPCQELGSIPLSTIARKALRVAGIF